MNQTDYTKNPDLLIMTRRHASAVVAALLFIFFMSFMMGYFLGTKHATEEFIIQMHQETFADQLLSSVCGLGNPPSSVPLSNGALKNESLETSSVSSDLQRTSLPEEDSTLSDTLDNDELYAAELIGFGKYEAATQFIARVTQATGINLELRTRHSKNQRGKKVTWYQVVTQRYPNKAALDTDLEQIVKKETLHDINRVTCKQTL
jgi:hypothetical protein